MAGMTREVLAFARGDKDLVVRKVYVNKFAEELTTQLGAAVAGRGIEFAVQARYDGIAFFDEQKLMRVFHNLTSNAVEAMPSGGRLCVAIDREGDDLVWTVTGTRGRASRRRCTRGCSSCSRPGRKGGTGLGLAIVEAHRRRPQGYDPLRHGPDGHDASRSASPAQRVLPCPS